MSRPDTAVRGDAGAVLVSRPGAWAHSGARTVFAGALGNEPVGVCRGGAHWALWPALWGRPGPPTAPRPQCRERYDEGPGVVWQRR